MVVGMAEVMVVVVMGEGEGVAGALAAVGEGMEAMVAVVVGMEVVLSAITVEDLGILLEIAASVTVVAALQRWAGDLVAVAVAAAAVILQVEAVVVVGGAIIVGRLAILRGTALMRSDSDSFRLALFKIFFLTFSNIMR